MIYPYRNKKGDEIIVPVDEFTKETWDFVAAEVAHFITTGQARGGNLVLTDFYDEYTDSFSLKREYAENVEFQIPEFYYGKNPDDYKSQIKKLIWDKTAGSIVIEAKFVLWANNEI